MTFVQVRAFFYPPSTRCARAYAARAAAREQRRSPGLAPCPKSPSRLRQIAASALELAPARSCASSTQLAARLAARSCCVTCDLRGPRGPRISTRFRHGDTYEVRTAWNRRVFVHRAPTRRSVKRAVHLGLRRFRGGHFARVSPIERMFWSWLPILPAPPVSTRCDPTTHSPISDLINMNQ